MNGDAYFDRMEQLKDIELGEKIGFKKGYEQAKKEFERPHGEWIPCTIGNIENVYKCSICSWFKNNTPCFCENCGADMRKTVLDQDIDGAGKDGNVKEGDEE